MSDEHVYTKGANGKYKCPCCEFFTLDEYNIYDICPVCFWEDDGAVMNEDFSGPNGMTLAEGRAAYKEHGYVSDDISQYVRLPLEDEKLEKELSNGRRLTKHKR